MATNNLTQTAYADHLRGCADLAIEIATRMNIHEDGARQATFATVIINAERHNLFMEPTPRDTKTPAPTAEQTSGKPVGSYEALVPEVNQGAIRQPTPEQAEAGAKKALLEGVERACKLLNEAGLKPPMTAKVLKVFIKTEMKIDAALDALDIDELEDLIKRLSEKLDSLAKGKASEIDAGF